MLLIAHVTELVLQQGQTPWTTDPNPDTSSPAGPGGREHHQPTPAVPATGSAWPRQLAAATTPGRTTRAIKRTLGLVDLYIDEDQQHPLVLFVDIAVRDGELGIRRCRARSRGFWRRVVRVPLPHRQAQQHLRDLTQQRVLFSSKSGA
jgi:hypothetical protein